MNKLLGNVIASLSSENVLSSWSVYKENNGCISLKIRYTESSCETNHNSNSHFRKKSQRQVNRDRARQQQWKASRHTVAEEIHPDQSETDQSVIPETQSVSDLGCTIRQDIANVSPVVTRSMARAASQTLNTPETIRHHDMSDSPTLDITMVSLDINQYSVSTVTGLDSLNENSVSSHDSEAEHGDDITQDDTTQDDITQDDTTQDDTTHDDTTQDYTDDISPQASREWEPPPGFCWDCWFNKPDRCDQHT